MGMIQGIQKRLNQIKSQNNNPYPQYADQGGWICDKLPNLCIFTMFV